MTIKTLSALSLSIITVSILSGCGGGDSSDRTVSSGANTLPTTSTGNNGAPSLRLNGSNPQQLAIGSAFVNAGAKASDTTDGNLSTSITESNNVNTSVAGCYQQTYMVSNNQGSASSISRTVLVGNDAERHSPNSAPITQEVSITNAYNSISVINLIDSAFDANCDTLTVTKLSTPAVGKATINNDGTVTFNPLGNVGSHYFTYTVSDSYGGSNTSGVSIASVDPTDGNDNWPQITGESVTVKKNTSILINVLENDFDADGDVLVLDGVDTPFNGTVEKQNGQVLYTPRTGFTGQDSFYYGVHDDHGHNGSGLVQITITE